MVAAKCRQAWTAAAVEFQQACGMALEGLETSPAAAEYWLTESAVKGHPAEWCLVYPEVSLVVPALATHVIFGQHVLCSDMQSVAHVKQANQGLRCFLNHSDRRQKNIWFQQLLMQHTMIVESGL